MALFKNFRQIICKKYFFHGAHRVAVNFNCILDVRRITAGYYCNNRNFFVSGKFKNHFVSLSQTFRSQFQPPEFAANWFEFFYRKM